MSNPRMQERETPAWKALNAEFDGDYQAALREISRLRRERDAAQAELIAEANRQRDVAMQAAHIADRNAIAQHSRANTTEAVLALLRGDERAAIIYAELLEAARAVCREAEPVIFLFRDRQMQSDPVTVSLGGAAIDRLRQAVEAAERAGEGR